MKYGKINHVGIVVKDWNEASDRYGRLLGIKPTRALSICVTAAKRKIAR